MTAVSDPPKIKKKELVKKIQDDIAMLLEKKKQIDEKKIKYKTNKKISDLLFILNDSYNGYLDQMYEFVVKVNEIDIGDQDKINNNMDKYVRYQEERDKGIGPDVVLLDEKLW